MEEKDIIKQMEEKKKIPKEVKNKIMVEIFECVISTIIVYIYFIFLKLGANNIHLNIYLTDLKVFEISLAVIAVVMFENAYNSKNSRKMVRGIEVLVLAMITMFLQYIILYLTPKYRIMIPLFAIIYNIYYILKSLVMVHKVKSEYKSSLSDIKEIVKDKKKKPNM